MLTNQNKVCPKCQRSRETYYVIEKDPKKKGKSWRIERCPKCSYNFDLEEVKDETGYSEDNKKGSHFREPFGRWGA